MPASDFDLKLLVPLWALLEEASVTRAGQRIQMSQPAMSSALSRLREQFGDELLVRIGHDYELTPTARQLLPKVQRAIGEIERVLATSEPFDPASSYRDFTIMASDFAALETRDVLIPALASSPNIAFEFSSLPHQPTNSERDLMTHDFIVSVPGVGIEGDSVELFVDHYVCLLDRDNPAIVRGELCWAAFCDLPQAVCDFGKAHLTPAERRLRELGFRREPQVKVSGFVPLPSIVTGTDLVAVVPSRLATRMAAATGTVAVAAPFGQVEIIEKVWWHPSRDTDPAHRWLRGLLAGSVERPERHVDGPDAP